MTNKCLGIVEWLQDWFTTTEDLVDVVYPIGSIYKSPTPSPKKYTYL